MASWIWQGAPSSPEVFNKYVGRKVTTTLWTFQRLLHHFEKTSSTIIRLEGAKCAKSSKTLSTTPWMIIVTGKPYGWRRNSSFLGNTEPITAERKSLRLFGTTLSYHPILTVSKERWMACDFGGCSTSQAWKYICNWKSLRVYKPKLSSISLISTYMSFASGILCVRLPRSWITHHENW